MTTVGTLVGLVLKERLFARSFERWKASLLLEQVARRYREPIALAALELCNRLSDICDDYPPKFLKPAVLDTPASQQPEVNSADDAHFLRYRLVSSVYRLCAYLGWVELYRQETTYLDPSEKGRGSRALYEVGSDLADGQLNQANDWLVWHDALLFREEQRAVGESMIVVVGNTRTIMGYAEFSELYPGGAEKPRGRWFARAGAFLLDIREQKDFRSVRFERLVVHLVDLVEFLSPHRLREEHIKNRERYRTGIEPALQVRNLPEPSAVTSRRMCT